MNTVEQYLVEEELEHYRDGWISRRDFLRRAFILGTGAAAAAAMAASVTAPGRLRAAPLAQRSPFSVDASDPTVSSEWVTFRSTDGVELRGYLARPAGAPQSNSLPGVTICHANRGLTAHVQDVARRFARQGYVAIAPDLPSRTGTPTDAFPDVESIMASYRQLTPEQNALDFASSLEFLRAHPAVDGSKLAGTGYCFGGGVIWRMSTVYPNLTAGAPFYGSPPPLADVPNIQAAMFAVHASTDLRLLGTIPEVATAMHDAGKRFKTTVYPNSDHGFHDDTGNVYNAQAAAQAYVDTLNWFAEHLSLPAPVVPLGVLEDLEA
jgi:carboxymethylenebutenolidase